MNPRHALAALRRRLANTLRPQIGADQSTGVSLALLGEADTQPPCPAQLDPSRSTLTDDPCQLDAMAQQLHALIDALPLPAFLVDAGGQVVQGNRRAGELFANAQTVPWPLQRLVTALHPGGATRLEAARRLARTDPEATARVSFKQAPWGSRYEVRVLQLGQDGHRDERQLLLFVNQVAEQAHAWSEHLAGLRLKLRRLAAPTEKELLSTMGEGLSSLLGAEVWQSLSHQFGSGETGQPESTNAPGASVSEALAACDLPAWLHELNQQTSMEPAAACCVLQAQRSLDAYGASVHLLALRLLPREATHPASILGFFRADRAYSDEDADALRCVGDETVHLLERHEQHRALHRISHAIEQSAEGVFITDHQGQLCFVNAGFETLAGRSSSELLGQSMDLLQLRHDDQAWSCRQWSGLLQRGPWKGEVWLRRQNGEHWPTWMHLSAISPAHGTATEVLGTVQDLRQRKADEQKIHQLAFYDPLTGLPNRRLLQDRLRRALARQRRSELVSVVFFIDLDDFKRVNDVLGHEQGDCLLQHVAHQLSTSLRENDTVAYMGGDEFVVLTELARPAQGSHIHAAEQIAHKLVSAVGQPVSLLGQRVVASPSVGIALVDQTTKTADDVLRHADLAMHKAKNAGRGEMRFFSPLMQAEAEARAQLEADLALALSENQLHLYFQTQVDAQGQVVGCEGLLRWQHSSQGLLTPHRFIAAAEHCGLILPLGRWVIEQACKQLASWQHNPTRANWTLAVNLSARQFRDPILVDWISKCLARHGVGRDRLELQFTEPALTDDLEKAVDTMHRLQALGVLLSLDDFGTGCTSLAYLQRLPLHRLYIDQRFVQRLPHQDADGVVVKAIIGLAYNLGLEPLAKGVETPEQHQFLQAAGCRLFQGHSIARAQPDFLLPN